MALQVAVDHEHLVAARVGAGPLANLLVVLLYVLLQGHTALSAGCGSRSTCHPQETGLAQSPAARRRSPSCRRPPGTRPCSPGRGTCRWWAAPPCSRDGAHAGAVEPLPAAAPHPGPPHLSQRSLAFQPGFGPGFLRSLGSSDFLASLLSLFLPETLKKKDEVRPGPRGLGTRSAFSSRALLQRLWQTCVRLRADGPRCGTSVTTAGWPAAGPTRPSPRLFQCLETPSGMAQQGGLEGQSLRQKSHSVREGQDRPFWNSAAWWGPQPPGVPERRSAISEKSCELHQLPPPLPSPAARARRRGEQWGPCPPTLWGCALQGRAPTQRPAVALEDLKRRAHYFSQTVREMCQEQKGMSGAAQDKPRADLTLPGDRLKLPSEAGNETHHFYHCC